jgi:hypothetical protein
MRSKPAFQLDRTTQKRGLRRDGFETFGHGLLHDENRVRRRRSDCAVAAPLAKDRRAGREPSSLPKLSFGNSTLSPRPARVMFFRETKKLRGAIYAGRFD